MSDTSSSSSSANAASGLPRAVDRGLGLSDTPLDAPATNGHDAGPRNGNSRHVVINGKPEREEQREE
ncbi:MAG: hypothetical protein AAGK78_14305, partial [Planctomycetota bacterium]